MRVRRQGVVDQGPPDQQGVPRYRYDFELFHFSDRGRTLVARSYADTPGRACFLHLAEGAAQRRLTPADLEDPLLLSAVAWLRSSGRCELAWLACDGYRNIAT
ncbi:MAG: hypothetical protein IPK27_01445 [Rhodanobacteraceae bacterium]|nr:hypothetical protein [Rhodanobacteraceae bacterium]